MGYIFSFLGGIGFVVVIGYLVERSKQSVFCPECYGYGCGWVEDEDCESCAGSGFKNA